MEVSCKIYTVWFFSQYYQLLVHIFKRNLFCRKLFVAQRHFTAGKEFSNQQESQRCGDGVCWWLFVVGHVQLHQDVLPLAKLSFQTSFSAPVGRINCDFQQRPHSFANFRISHLHLHLHLHVLLDAGNHLSENDSKSPYNIRKLTRLWMDTS